MTANKLTTGVRSLSPADKKLLLAFFACDDRFRDRPLDDGPND